MVSKTIPVPATAGGAPASSPHPASSSTSMSTSQSFHDITSTYAARFGKNDDQVKVTDEERQARQETAAEGANQYYDFATYAYLSGWGTAFHYCPFAPHDTILSAIYHYEHRLALVMDLRPGMKVLDVGCGVGGPAREIAKLFGCEIVGITINQRQVDKAIEMTAQAGLEHLCTFMQGDFLKLDEYFPPESFDAAYAIEATVHAPSLKNVYSGIAKALKPDAVFGVSEWVLTPGYDPSNTTHVGIRNRIERGNAISNLHTSDQCRDALVQAGFKMHHDEDYSKHWDHLSRPNQPTSPPFSPVTIPTITTPIRSSSPNPPTHYAPPPSRPPFLTRHPLRPWYWPMAGQHHLATTWTDWWIAFRMSRSARLACYYLVVVLELLRIYPKGVKEAMTTLAYCVDSVVEGGREGCFTPCWFFVGRKDGNGDEEGMLAIGGRKLRFRGHGNLER